MGRDELDYYVVQPHKCQIILDENKKFSIKHFTVWYPTGIIN